MRVAANLTMMFQGIDLPQKYEKATALGFQLVEVSLPYGWPAEELRQQADRHHLKHVLINAPAGDWSAGFRGLAALPEQKSKYVESISAAVQYAKTLDVKKVHVMAGLANRTDENCRTYVENIRFACQQLAKESMICLIEPICEAAIPGYFLNSYSKALEVVEEIKEPNLKIMLDLFHAQQICGQLTNTTRTLAPFVGHVQIAQVPDRHEPDTDGEINYSYIFKMLKKYGDWDIGCEYLDSGFDKQYVQWVHRYGLTF